MLCNLTLAIQNVNSLNVSTNCPKQLKKLCALNDLNADIIFLSDLRFNGNMEVVRDIENTFLASNKQYVLVHNSSMRSRGTGMLISSKIECAIVDEMRDVDENILAVLCTIKSCPVLLISIYGPNTNNCDSFFKCLDDLLSKYPDIPTIIGGDWNCTVSLAKAESNIDVHNMKNPPSLIRSAMLAKICENYNVSDPFRALHPKTRNFTYIPKDGAKNRSRLDFFLISDHLMQFVSSCKIVDGLLTELFDHKSVIVSFGNKALNNKINISPVTLKHDMIDMVIYGSVLDTYRAHLCPINHSDDAVTLAEQLGRFFRLLREINDLEKSEYDNGREPVICASREAKVAEIHELRNSMPDCDGLADMILSCKDDVFLEVLLGNIRNSIISFQSWLRKVKTSRRGKLVKKLKTCV